MAGTFTVQVLADGQVASTPTALYTAASGVNVYIHNVNFVNVSGISQTVILYYQRTTAREIGRAVLTTTGYRWEYLEHPLHLEAGDSILASATADLSVDYIVTGVEET